MSSPSDSTPTTIAKAQSSTSTTTGTTTADTVDKTDTASSQAPWVPAGALSSQSPPPGSNATFVRFGRVAPGSADDQSKNWRTVSEVSGLGGAGSAPSRLPRGANPFAALTGVTSPSDRKRPPKA